MQRDGSSSVDARDGAEHLQQRVAPPPVTPNNSSTTPSVPSGENIHYISMEGVIPNSKVVIIPPNTPGFGEWRRELYLRPGEWIPWVTVTLVVATLVLGIIVYAFHWNERVCRFSFHCIGLTECYCRGKTSWKDAERFIASTLTHYSTCFSLVVAIYFTTSDVIHSRFLLVNAQVVRFKTRPAPPLDIRALPSQRQRYTLVCT